MLMLSVPSKDPRCAGSIQVPCMFISYLSPSSQSDHWHVGLHVQDCPSLLVFMPSMSKTLEECPQESLPCNCQVGAGMPHMPRSCDSCKSTAPDCPSVG